MSRRRGRTSVHGWLVVDKPSGMTSVAVLSTVRRLFDHAKAGHGGTLDPLATGVLPIAFGEATKTMSYVMDAPKSYRFTVRWGARSDTDDAEGRIIAESSQRPAEADIRAALSRFTGDIEQVPPTYSAVKIDGQRAYALARAETPALLPPRPVTIEAIELVDVPDRDHATFAVRCGKGAYMRSLARDLAEVLGTVGHVSALRRISAGPFSEDDALTLDDLRSLASDGRLSEALRPVGAALAEVPALLLTEAEVRQMRRGQAIAALPVAQRLRLRSFAKGAVVCSTQEGIPVALAQVSGGAIRPVRVLNL